MVRKSKPRATKTKSSKAKPNQKPANGPLPWERIIELYPSLAQGPTPAERRAKLIQKARAQGVKPMTAEEYDRHIEEFRDMWGSDDEIDAFVAWIHKSRREGRSG